MTKRFFVALIVLCGAASPSAQAAYGISGQVVDHATRKPLAGAAVRIEWQDEGGAKPWRVVAETKTAADGSFALSAPDHDYFLTRVEAQAEGHARFLDRHNRSSNFEFRNGAIELAAGDAWALIDGEWVYPVFQLWADSHPAQLSFSGAAAYEIYRNLDGPGEARGALKLRRGASLYCTESDDQSESFWDRHTCTFDNVALSKGSLDATHGDPGSHPGGVALEATATVMFDVSGAESSLAVFVDDFKFSRLLYDRLWAIAWPWRGYSYSKKGEDYVCTHTPHEDSPQGPDAYQCRWNFDLSR